MQTRCSQIPFAPVSDAASKSPIPPGRSAPVTMCIFHRINQVSKCAAYPPTPFHQPAGAINGDPLARTKCGPEADRGDQSAQQDAI